MNVVFKRKMTKKLAITLSVLTIICLSVIIFAVSPFNPGNVSDEKVAKFGIEYDVKLIGISKCDENGFTVATDGFYFTDEPIFVYVGEDGYAHTSYDYVTGIKVYGRYSSLDVLYNDYSFCGETYKTKEDLQKFFDSPDPIYGFEFDKLSNYIQDIINYEKKFLGKAVIKAYRGRYIITEVYIGAEKVLEINK